MTQKEFMERAGVVPTSEEFDYIHAVYMNTSMDKDEFCKDFKKHGGSSVLRDVHARAVTFELQDKQKQALIEEVAEFLIGKACAYEDTDFYKQAVKLVGQKKVTRMKLEMDLPLWKEDKEYIKENLK